MKNSLITITLLAMGFKQQNSNYKGEDNEYLDYSYRDLEVTLHHGKIHRVSVATVDISIEFPVCKTTAQVHKLKRMLYVK